MRARTLMGGILLVAITAVVVIGMHGRKSPVPVGHVTALLALDDGSAVFTRRELATGSLTVVRVDASAGVGWARALDEGANFTTIEATADAVFIRDSTACQRDTKWDRCNESLFSLSLDDGAPRWQRRPAVRAGRSLDRYGLGPVVVRDRYIDGLHSARDRSDTLFALDVNSGQLAWEVSLPEARLGVAIAGGRYLFEDLGVVTAIDTRSGASVTAKQGGRGCVLDGDYYAIPDNTAPVLTLYPRGDLGSPRALGPIRLLGRRPLLSNVLSCGRYGEQLVLALETRSNPAPGQTLVLLLTDRHARSQRLIEVADADHFDVSLDQHLGRFILVSYSRSRGLEAPTTHALAAIDLERNEVTFQGALDNDAFPVTTFHVAGNGYATWWTPGSDVDTLLVLDGANGAVRALETRGKVEREHVAGGKIWLLGRGDHALDRLPITVLDARTLAPIHARGRIHAVDVTEQVRRQLR